MLKNLIKNLVSRAKLRFEHYLLLPAIIVLLLLAIYPLICALNTTLYNVFLTKPIERTFIGLQNYIYVVQDSRFVSGLSRSLYFVILAVGGSFILGLGISLLLHREIRGKSVIRTCLIIPMVMTPVIVGYTFMFMLDPSLGVVNLSLKFLGQPGHPFLGDPSTALTTTALVDIWQWTPFVVLVLLAALESLPQAPFEAAKIEGASRWQVFRHLTLPLLKPAAAIVILIRLMDAFRVFDTIYIMTQGGPGLASETLPIYIWRSGFSWFHTSRSTVMGLIMLFIIMVTCWIFFRKVVAGREGT